MIVATRVKLSSSEISSFPLLFYHHKDAPIGAGDFVKATLKLIPLKNQWLMPIWYVLGEYRHGQEAR
jgi:hypothetical protein